MQALAPSSFHSLRPSQQSPYGRFGDSYSTRRRMTHDCAFQCLAKSFNCPFKIDTLQDYRPVRLEASEPFRLFHPAGRSASSVCAGRRREGKDTVGGASAHAGNAHRVEPSWLRQSLQESYSPRRRHSVRSDDPISGERKTWNRISWQRSHFIVRGRGCCLRGRTIGSWQILFRV